MKKRPTNVVKRIIRLYLSHDFSSNEKKLFNSWLTSDVHLPEKERVLEDIWNKRIKPDRNPDARTAAAFRKLSARLKIPQADLCGESSISIGNRSGLSRLSWSMAAAVIPLLILIGATVFYCARHSDVSIARHRVDSSRVQIAAYETPREVWLEDSTRLLVNASSEINFKKIFQPERLVLLKGEAYFEVCKDPGNPFVVQTEHLRVTVLGTSFTVSDVRKEELLGVSVYRGSVRVEIADQTYILTEGQGLVHNKSQRKTDIYLLQDQQDLWCNYPENPDRVLGFVGELVGTFYEDEIETQRAESLTTPWLGGPLELSYTPLSEILNRIGQRYGITIGKLPSGIPDDVLSIYLDGSETLEETLFRVMTLSGNFIFTIEGNQVFIREN